MHCEEYRIASFCFPIQKQLQLQNEKEKPVNNLIDEADSQTKNLIESCLGLLQEDKRLAACNKPTDHSSPFQFDSWLLDVLRTKQWIEPITMDVLLKVAGLPNKIPEIKKIFKRSLYLLSEVRRLLFGIETEGIEKADLDPLWSTIILPSLSGASQKAAHKSIPENVERIANLYLDLTRPFLLFSFDHRLAQGDGHLVGELSFTQRWAKKISTKLITISMNKFGSIDHLPDLLPPIAESVLEVKDSRKEVGFVPLEPISSTFTNSVKFYHGLLRALQLQPKMSKSPTALWIFKNLSGSKAYTEETAGFIFGLGCSGHLKEFKSADVYELLSANKEGISSAVLLGLGLSHLGQGYKIKFLPQTIGIHIPGYLPDIDTSSPQLYHVPLGLQISAVLALGFAFHKTRDSRTASILFKEISRRGQISAKIKSLYSPAYSLAAGFSLGLVGIPEEHVGKLLELVNGETADPDFGAPSAFFALLLNFAGSNDSFIAKNLKVPSLTSSDLNHIKPVHLMLLALLNSLVTGVFPYDINVLLKSVKSSLKQSSKGVDHQLVYLCHLVSAYVLYLAMFRAGSFDGKILNQILTIQKLVSQNQQTLADEKKAFASAYNRQALEHLEDMCFVSASVIMSGSGNHELFTLLQKRTFMNLLDEQSPRHYFHHLALGYLLLGDGKLRLDTGFGQDPLKVASLIASIWAGFNYPLLEDYHHVPIYFQCLWPLAVFQLSNCPVDIMATAYPEDAFLDTNSADLDDVRAEYYRQVTNGLFEELSKEKLLFLQNLFTTIQCPNRGLYLAAIHEQLKTRYVQ